MSLWSDSHSNNISSSKKTLEYKVMSRKTEISDGGFVKSASIIKFTSKFVYFKYLLLRHRHLQTLTRVFLPYNLLYKSNLLDLGFFLV